MTTKKNTMMKKMNQDQNQLKLMNSKSKNNQKNMMKIKRHHSSSVIKMKYKCKVLIIQNYNLIIKKTKVNGP